MVTITAATFSALINQLRLNATAAEEIIDQAVDLLNLYGADLPNMTGIAGSKTLSVESKEKGAIFLVARIIYKSFYKDEGVNVSAGPAGITAVDLLSNGVVLRAVEQAAQSLKELDISIG